MGPLMVKSTIPVSACWEVTEECLRSVAYSGSIKSDAFQVSSIPGMKYSLSIMPNGLNHDGKTLIFLELLKDLSLELDAKLTCFIETAKMTANFASFAYYGDLVEYKCFACSPDDLFDPRKRFIVDGKLTIEVTGNLEVQKPKRETPTLQMNQLGHSLWNADDKDFVIEVNGKEITAHKWVLSHCSPVFSAMFNSPMLEAASNRTHIPDFSFKVVEAAVKYCYDLDINGALSQATSLLQFADKYQMNDFKDKLEAYLIAELSVSNVCQLSNASIISNASKLNNACFDFLMKCMKNSTSVGDIAVLADDFRQKLFKRSFFHCSKS